MTEEKTCSRCGACCRVLPLFTQHMHPDFRKYLLTRGLTEDKEQGCILISHKCQHLIEESRVKAYDEVKKETIDEPVYACDIYYDPERPELCKKFHGQKLMKNARIYVPPGCVFAKSEIGMGQLSASSHKKRLRSRLPAPRKGTNDKRGCKKILQQHHDDLKHDPERLSTKFIIDVAGCSCKVVQKKMENQDV